MSRHPAPAAVVRAGSASLKERSLSPRH
jgi:hypothetical protein